MTHLVILDLQLLVLGLVAASDLLHLCDGLDLLLDVVVFSLQFFLQRVSLRCETAHGVSQRLQLRLGGVTAGAGSETDRQM